MNTEAGLVSNCTADPHRDPHLWTTAEKRQKGGMTACEEDSGELTDRIS